MLILEWRHLGEFAIRIHGRTASPSADLSVCRPSHCDLVAWRLEVLANITCGVVSERGRLRLKTDTVTTKTITSQAPLIVSFPYSHHKNIN